MMKGFAICKKSFLGALFNQNIVEGRSKQLKDMTGQKLVFLCTLIEAKKEYEDTITKFAFAYIGSKMNLPQDFQSQLVEMRERIKATYGQDSAIYRLLTCDYFYVLDELTNLVHQSLGRVLATMSQFEAEPYPHPRECAAFSPKSGVSEIVEFLDHFTLPPNDASKFLEKDYVQAFNLQAQIGAIQRLFSSDDLKRICDYVNFLATYLKAKDSGTWNPLVILTEDDVLDGIGKCGPDCFFVMRY